MEPHRNNNNLSQTDLCPSVTSIKTLKKELNPSKPLEEKAPTLKSFFIEQTDDSVSRRSWRQPGMARTLYKWESPNIEQKETPQEDFVESIGSESECSYEEYDLRDFERVTGHLFTAGGRRTPFFDFQTDQTGTEELHENDGCFEDIFLKFEQEANNLRSKEDDLQRTLGETEIEEMLERIEMKEQMASIQDIEERKVGVRSESCEIKPRLGKGKLSLGRSVSIYC